MKTGGKLKHYQLGKKFPDVYLTKREAECVYHIMRGKTMRNIADTLGISTRTVESYITNIKEKLSCHTKSELIAIILEIGFMKKIDF